MAVHVNTLYLIWSIVAWLVLYQLMCWAVALLHRKALVGWSLGPLGVSLIYLDAPPASWRIAQFGLPALAVAGASYLGLYVVHPGPITGLDPRPLARLASVALAGLAVLTLQAFRIAGDLRFPLWGEARVLACVQRSRALGGLVHFTAAGRAFLRERYGATPREFLRTVR